MSRPMSRMGGSFRGSKNESCAGSAANGPLEESTPGRAEPRVSLEVAVIGGGIGGLSAALQLLRVGVDVHVYEQAPRIAEIGAGIQISPNASRLLHRLGLRPSMDAVGVRPIAVH